MYIATVCVYKEAEIPQQDIFDDFEVFPSMGASQSATSSGAHPIYLSIYIEPAYIPGFWVYIAHCTIKQQAPNITYTKLIAGLAGMQPGYN